MNHIKKTYIIVTIFLAIILGLLIATFTFTTKLIEREQTETILLERDNVSLEVVHYFHTIETILDNIEIFIENNYNNDDELLTYITDISESNDLIFSIYLGKPDKTMINSSGFVPGDDFDLTTRLWYEMAIASDSHIYTPAFINASEDAIIVTAAKTIYFGEDIFGVLAVDIDIKSITSVVSETKVGENGYVFLIDKNNHLIAHPDLINDEVVLLLSSFTDNQLISQGDGFIDEISIDDEKGVIAYRQIANNSYTISAFMPIDEFSSPMEVFRQVIIIVFVVVIASALILLFVFKKQIDNPFKNLISDILDINIDKNIAYRLSENNNKQFKPVISAINNMLDSTDYYFTKSKESQRKLTLENQRVKLLMESTGDIIFEINKDKVFISVFGNGIKKLNMKPEDFIGKTITQVFGDNGNERDKIYTKALQGEHSIYDWHHKTNNKILYFESSISPIYDEDNIIIGAVGISRDITEPMEKQKQIEYISTHDFLTGLYNRRYFVETFSKIKEKQYPVGLMMLDLNGLKILNDAYGHDIGDKALKKAAKTILKITPSKATVSRIGGDEFAIILPNTSNEELQQVKSKIDEALNKITIENVPLSIAIGYEISNDYNSELQELLKNAENSMYRSKITEGKSIRNNTIQAIFETLTNKYEQEKIHSERVAKISYKIGKAMKIKADDLKELKLAGLYHDIGKITIPDSILNKPTKLTKDEFDIIKKHTENGYNILRAADQYSNLAEYALSHHERWDGLGYPQGLAKTQIPLFSRIICIADAYEAMTSKRPYKEAITKKEAIEEIIACSGKQFDPSIAKIFIEKVLKNQ
ncbi:MAG: HD domain-containing phosphohydrolase [Bacillota bacterium]